MALAPRLVLTLCAALALAGCAHDSRSRSPLSLRFSQVLLVPVGDTLSAARTLLEEKGYSFEGDQDPGQLLTRWMISKRERVTVRSRYLVTSISAGEYYSMVRIFRMTSEGSGDLVRERDAELEAELARRLVPGTAASGAASGSVWEPPPDTGNREEEFYLTRWQEDWTCDRKVKGLEDVLEPGLVMLIGEQLGSREAPAVVGDLVCQAAKTGVAVALGVSIPSDEQARIDRYLASPGAPADQDRLLEGAFWRRPYQDGRSSRAVFDLIDRVRAMRGVGLRVSLVAYDTDHLRASDRDAALAKVWLDRHAASPDEVLVVLAGNMHVRTVTGAPWDQDFTPMAHHLKVLPALKVLEVGYAPGRRWGCDLDKEGKLDCRIVGAVPESRLSDRAGANPYVYFYSTPTEEGYQGFLFVGALSASLPALSKVPKKIYRRGPVAVPPPPPPARYTEPTPRNGVTRPQ